MQIINRIKSIALLLVFVPFVILASIFFTNLPKAFGLTSRVDLLTSDGFAVLGGSAISNTPTSVINGHVGLDPTGGASITGLTCAEMATGTIYDNNGGYAGGGGGSTACRVTDAGLLTTAKNDLTTAYNDAAGRSITSTIATDLAGATLTDGVYHAASDTFSITGGGTLTLDGGGDANAVFIFKAGSTFITSSSSKVVLTNSAQACNVYWQVGSSATLGTSTTLVGNILALTSITDDGSSTVNGRLLARNGAVTLNNTRVTKQTCASPTATPTPTTTPAPTVTPTPTPTPTSSSSSSSTSSSDSSSSTGTTVYPALASSVIAPTIIESRRVDADGIFISWGPYSGVDTFNVQYGLESGKWTYNTDVTGFSTTINSLPLNQPIYVRIAARNTGVVGAYGGSKLVGQIEIINPKVLGASTNINLPNTGFAPLKRNNSWSILADIGVSLLILFALIQGKSRFSSRHEDSR